MSWKRVVPLFVLSYILVLVITAPASLVRQLLPVPAGLAVGPVTGSVWKGGVEWLVSDGVRLGPLRWSLNPLQVFSATPLSVSMASPVSTVASLGMAEDQHLAVADAEIKTSVVDLLQQLNYPDFGIDADIEVLLASAEFSPAGCRSLTGTVKVDRWQGELEGLSDMGELSGRLSCDNGRLELTVDPDNAINLSGRLVVHTTGRYQVDMRAAPPRGPLFDQLVQFLGQPRDGRSFVIRARS